MSELLPGTRVEILGNPIGVRFTARTGTVTVREDEDHYIVHLDSPATYRDADPMPDIRVMGDNLRVLR